MMHIRLSQHTWMMHIRLSQGTWMLHIRLSQGTWKMHISAPYPYLLGRIVMKFERALAGNGTWRYRGLGTDICGVGMVFLSKTDETAEECGHVDEERDDRQQRAQRAGRRWI